MEPNEGQTTAPPTAPGPRIIELRADNVKRLRAVHIAPASDVVVVTGKNSAGKSSVLDSIALALAGGDASRAVVCPIRDGEKRASVELRLTGGLRVTRKWRIAKGGETVSEIELANDDGATFKSPQAILDAMIGDLAFDPLAFTRMAPDVQRAELLRVAGKRAEFDAIEAERRAAYDARTDANRELKRAQAALASMPSPAADVQRVDVSALAAELTAADATNAAREAALKRVAQANIDVAAAQSRVDVADLKAVELRKQLAAAESAAAEARAVADAAKIAAEKLAGEAGRMPVADTSAVRQRIAESTATNKAADAADAYRAAADRVDKLSRDAEAADVDLENIATKARMLLNGAALPVDGLGVGDNGVTYHGRPLADCSMSERLRVSVGICMAAAPRLKVMRISDGSLLDNDGMAELERLATAHGFQVWVERVDDERPGAVVIEDGAVRP